MDFRNKVKTSFFNVRRDVHILKQSINNWTSYLDNKQNRLEIKIIELENKLSRLEKEKKIIIK